MAETRGRASRIVLKLVAAWMLLPLFFLVVGGSLAWWQAWVYCAILLVPMTVFAISMARSDPGFFDRRFKVREKEKAQRRLQAWGTPIFLAAFIVPGLDHRFGWSDPPLEAIVAAMPVALLGYLIVLRVFWENRWAGRTVETWTEQELVSTGPYAIVRHPMYTGVIVMYLATPIALGSWWGVLPALGTIPILVTRIGNEEQVLIRDLTGYDGYRQKVRYRLVPFVW